MTDTQCVGFVECPCKGCRVLRRNATEAHKTAPKHDDPYCGACRTIRLNAYYVGPPFLRGQVR